jgi:hypothetical protein
VICGLAVILGGHLNYATMDCKTLRLNSELAALFFLSRVSHKGDFT